ncbi:4-hydroxythreonine-4-phosphate dehydrogenase PdxA [Coraliomargarita akajimensis]|uniref:4-hydroxythreonine-4-phosphate dehydrogenase n=1 Tax=Coraliomargarita akajimensis (strain DSM 45221 / IAM 15411 / JCM 23193 / KCTC 12865 / 04OKA010-24) TaxID=583355 RepID=D5EQB8_CORAD|nr:4-hydroxythreonine-4-phosphate dehydrogenase PdxA [Coraliomargarita akajimensis]ADE53886.1 4-hydroxythreonine-4-phosphate dehydrogenase [Coraliomargarita akajimensis DSM 45221]
MSRPVAAQPLAITCGDPAGVGPEVIADALRADPQKGSDCVLLGPWHWVRPLADSLGIGYDAIGPADYHPKPGDPCTAGAAVALAALEHAARGCVDGRYRGVVTGPVSKHWMQQVGFQHPGQTEFFADAWGGDATMAFVGKQLKVVLATWHIPLAQVSDALTADALELAVRRADQLAQQYGIKEPRIAVCGLNPHAGEGGILGSEERDVLDPTLDRLRQDIPGLSSCLPGDTVFNRQLRGDFDVVVAAYHDQGLAAVKTLEFDSAVNVTLGLPYVRTSPDHGTAFGIAGQGKANAESFAAALSVARQLTQR